MEGKCVDKEEGGGGANDLRDFFVVGWLESCMFANWKRHLLFVQDKECLCKMRPTFILYILKVT